MTIYTIGHLSPDLDAIASAVAYADFLIRSGRYPDYDIVPLRPGEPNREVINLFKKFSLDIPASIDDVEIKPEDKFVLVDHNETTQRHPKIQNDQIIEVLDHHKVNVNFGSPIRFDVRPVGSTCSIIFDIFQSEKITPSHEIAGIILSAKLSDTLSLKSATTTRKDVDIANYISDEYGLELPRLTFEVFKAKSDLSGMSMHEVIKKDYKVFEFSGKKVFISTVETVEPDKVMGHKQDIVTELGKVKAELGVDLGFVFVSDILKIYSIGIYQTEEEKNIINRAFNVNASENAVNVGPITSRKKDIAPAIEKALK